MIICPQAAEAEKNVSAAYLLAKRFASKGAGALEMYGEEAVAGTLAMCLSTVMQGEQAYTARGHVARMLRAGCT